MKFQLHTNFHCLGCKFLVKLKKKIKNIILLTKKKKKEIMRECLTPKRTYNIFRVKLLHFVNISQIFLSYQWFLGYFGFFYFFILEVLGIFWWSNEILVNLDISRGISVETFGNFEDSKVILGVIGVFDKFEHFRDTLIILEVLCFSLFFIILVVLVEF